MSVRSSLGNPKKPTGSVGEVHSLGNENMNVTVSSGTAELDSITLGPGTWNIQINGILANTTSNCNMVQLDLDLSDPVSGLVYLVSKEMPTNGYNMVQQGTGLQFVFWRSVVVSILESTQFVLSVHSHCLVGSVTVTCPVCPPNKNFTVTKLA